MKLFIALALILSSPAFGCNLQSVIPTYSYSDFNNADGKPTLSENAIDLLNCLVEDYGKLSDIKYDVDLMTFGQSKMTVESALDFLGKNQSAEDRYNVDLMVYGSSSMTVEEALDFLGSAHSNHGAEIASPDATDLGTAITLLNEIKDTLNTMNGY